MKIKQAIALFLIIICHGCKNKPAIETIDNSAAILQMFNISIKCQNHHFPSAEIPIRNKLIIFFNTKSCPSCIIDLKGYIDVMKRNYNVDADFYTNLENKNLNGIDKLIPSLNKISVDTLYSNLQYPILFETNNDGQVINCMPINSSYLYISFDYIKKYALDHPRLVK